MSSYATLIRPLAPEYDPAHVEAWMRLEHDTLDALDATRFASEVKAAVACVLEAGTEQTDQLARSYGLCPFQAGDEILVSRDDVPDLEAAEATISAISADRPHVVKVNYAAAGRTGAWIARRRIVEVTPRPRPRGSAAA